MKHKHSTRDDPNFAFRRTHRNRFKKIPDIYHHPGNKMLPMKEDTVLFRKEYYNEYSYLGYKKRSNCVSITLLKSDWKAFAKIKGDFLNGFSFAVKDKWITSELSQKFGSCIYFLRKIESF